MFERAATGSGPPPHPSRFYSSAMSVSGGAAQVLVGDLLDRDVLSCGAQADLAALEHVHGEGEDRSMYCSTRTSDTADARSAAIAA
jgi:hypothetical protein